MSYYEYSASLLVREDDMKALKLVDKLRAMAPADDQVVEVPCADPPGTTRILIEVAGEFGDTEAFDRVAERLGARSLEPSFATWYYDNGDVFEDVTYIGPARLRKRAESERALAIVRELLPNLTAADRKRLAADLATPKASA